jgi:hypothetical protein
MNRTLHQSHEAYQQPKDLTQKELAGKNNEKATVINNGKISLTASMAPKDTIA